MKSLLFILIITSCSVAHSMAEEIDTREAIGITAGRSVDAAVKRAAKENKRVLVIAADPEKKSQTFHVKGMMEFEETKALVKEHFILVATDFKDKNIRAFVGEDSTERPAYFLLSKEGTLIQKGTTAIGGSAGNQLIKSWVAAKP